MRHARACGRLAGAAAQLAVVVPRAGLLAEGAGLAAGVLPPQPVVAGAGAQLRRDRGVGSRPARRSLPVSPPRGSRPAAVQGAARRVPSPSCSRSGEGARVPGPRWQAGSVGPAGRWCPGHRPRGAEAPLRLEGAGPGAGWPSPDARGSRSRAAAATASAAPQSRRPHRPAQPRVSAEPSRGDAPRGSPLQRPSPRRLPPAQGPGCPARGRGCAYLCLCRWPPLCTWRQGGGDPTPALPDPPSRVTARPAPPSAQELCRPDITRARQSSPVGDARGRPRLATHTWPAPHTWAPHPARPPARCDPAPAPLSSAGCCRAPGLHPSPPSSIPPSSPPSPRNRIPRPPCGQRAPPPLSPLGSGSRPRPSRPHLETIAIRVSDTDTLAPASGFRGREAARVTASARPVAAAPR